VTDMDARSTSTEEVVSGGPFVQVMEETTVTVTDMDARGTSTEEVVVLGGPRCLFKNSIEIPNSGFNGRDPPISAGSEGNKVPVWPQGCSITCNVRIPVLCNIRPFYHTCLNIVCDKWAGMSTGFYFVTNEKGTPHNPLFMRVDGEHFVQVR
jgi:hypothetical protein